jgi:NAD(P)-dependent dehydrogenase (short-subunit alcohol dehydrogenase family)
VIDFANQVVVVTGAGKGMGRMYALELAARGAAVVVNDRGTAPAGTGSSTEAADAVVDEIRAAGGQAVANHDSVSDPATGERLVHAALSAFGRLDAMIANAGTFTTTALASMSTQEVDAMVSVNLMAAIYSARAAAPTMSRQGYGRIVFVSSNSGLVGADGQAPYSAAKAGILGLTKSLAKELWRDGVMVNAVTPTASTRMSQGMLQRDIEPFMGPEQVVPATLWLSSRACRTTGEVFAVGGGYFTRLVLQRGLGVQLDPRQPVTPEMFDAAFDRISDVSQSVPFEGLQPVIAAHARSEGWA